MSADDEQKLKRLNAVFVKALDMTTDSITQIELKESFQAETGSISSVENMFVNTIGKMKLSVEGKFSALCQEQGSVAIQAHGVIVEKENAPNQKARSGNMTDELQACEREILAREIEKLTGSVDQLKQQIQNVNTEIFDSILPAAREYEAQLSRCDDLIAAPVA